MSGRFRLLLGPRVPPVRFSPIKGAFYVGMNTSGFEQNAGAVPGVAGTDYIPPTPASLDRMLAFGIKDIRLPFLWDRIQPNVGGALDSAYLALLDAFIAHGYANGQRFMLDLHSYGGRREGTIGSSAVPVSAFADVWSRIAAHYKGMPGVVRYDLMNEPQSMLPDPDGAGDTIWYRAAQAAINAIGAVDATPPIDVEGNNYSGAWEWTTRNPRLHLLTSLGNPLRFQAHGYPDFNNSGTLQDFSTGQSLNYDQQVAHAGEAPSGLNVGPDILAQRFKVFTDWLLAHDLEGCIGETNGFYDDPRWLTILDRGLDFLRLKNTACYIFASGLRSVLGVDADIQGRPVQGRQIAVLAKYTKAPSPTSYTIIGPPVGTVGQPSTFTLEYDGLIAAPITFTPTDFGRGGSFSPANLTLPAGFNGIATFAYTPAQADTLGISATNSAGFTDPTAVIGTEQDMFRQAGVSAENVFDFTKLVTSYAGDCLILRRASDSATKAFGFVGTKVGSFLNVGAIQDWAGTGAMTLVQFNDQSLNARHWTAVQGTDNNVGPAVRADEPAFLLDGGDGKPLVRFASSRMEFVSPINGNTAQTILSVHNWTSGVNVASWQFTSAASVWGSPTWTLAEESTQGQATGIVANAWHAYASRWRAAQSAGRKSWVDGVLGATVDTTAASLVMEYGRNNAQTGWYRFGTPSNPSYASFDVRSLIVLKDAPDGLVAAHASYAKAAYPLAASYVPPAPDPNNTPTLPLIGANRSGMDGDYFTDPSGTGLRGRSAYYYDRGLNTIRAPFKRYRIQQTPGAAISRFALTRNDNSTYYGLDALDNVMAECRANGLFCILDAHDYGEEWTGGGSGTVSQAQFSDFWVQVYQRYASNPKLIIDLQNEPHAVSATTAIAYQQAAITALRNAGYTGYILVEGGGSYAQAYGFVSTGAAAAFKTINDPLNKCIAEVHCYLDAGGSGTSDNFGGPSYVGERYLVNITEWSRANGVKLFLGEFAVPYSNVDARNKVSRQLDYISANTDVWVGWTVWNIGPSYETLPAELEHYPFDYPATNGVTDKVSMAVLTSHGVASAYNAAPYGIGVNWAAGFDGGFIPLGAAAGATIATLTALDPNIAGNTWTFAKLTDPDGVFTLAGSTLKLAAPIADGTSHSGTFKVSDDKGLNANQTITIQCNSVTTLNPNDTGTGIALSNGNLTASYSGSGNSLSRTNKGKSTGKWYFEVLNQGAQKVGLARPLEALEMGSDMFGGGLGNASGFMGVLSVAWYGNGVVQLGSGVATVAAHGGSGTLCFAFDAGARLLWLRLGSGNWNNNASANPATGVGGIDISAIRQEALFPAVNCYASGHAATFRLAVASFTQAVPSGFSAM